MSIGRPAGWGYTFTAPEVVVPAQGLMPVNEHWEQANLWVIHIHKDAQSSFDQIRVLRGVCDVFSKEGIHVHTYSQIYEYFMYEAHNLKLKYMKCPSFNINAYV